MERNEIKQLIDKRNEEIKRLNMEYWDNLKPFESPDDIPMIPYCPKEEWDSFYVPRLLKCGAIPKDKLVVGKTYIGNCRNSGEATWNGKEFEYERYKFGFTYKDKVNHFQDDDGYDLFVPIKEKEENDE